MILKNCLGKILSKNFQNGKLACAAWKNQPGKTFQKNYSGPHKSQEDKREANKIIVERSRLKGTSPNVGKKIIKFGKSRFP